MSLVRISFNQYCFCARCCQKVRFGASYWTGEWILKTCSGKNYRNWGGRVLCPGCYCWLGGMRYDPSIEQQVVIENGGQSAYLHAW